MEHIGEQHLNVIFTAFKGHLEWEYVSEDAFKNGVSRSGIRNAFYDTGLFQGRFGGSSGNLDFEIKLLGKA